VRTTVSLENGADYTVGQSGINYLISI